MRLTERMAMNRDTMQQARNAPASGGSGWKDRAAMQAEISRLRRIEAKVDGSMRAAIIRKIQELEIHLDGNGSRAKAGHASELKKTG